MIQLTRALVRRWLDVLLHIDDTPERTAAAFALGVLIGFSPFLGLHTILGVLIALAFNLNRVAVLLGIYSNLPWIIAQYYAFTTMAGAAITRTQLPPDLFEQLRDLFAQSITTGRFWNDLVTLVRPLLWPFTVGSLIGAALLAAMAYPLALAFVRSRRRLHGLVHKAPRA